MKAALNQAGASHLVALVAVLVIAAIGVVGFRVLNNDQIRDNATTSNSSSTEASKFNSKADVIEADKQLDSTSLDDINPDQLDSDLDSIL